MGGGGGGGGGGVHGVFFLLALLKKKIYSLCCFPMIIVSFFLTLNETEFEVNDLGIWNWVYIIIDHRFSIMIAKISPEIDVPLAITLPTGNINVGYNWLWYTTTQVFFMFRIGLWDLLMLILSHRHWCRGFPISEFSG